MTDLVKRLRDTASKGVSVWGDFQMEAAAEIERLQSETIDRCANQAALRAEVERLREALEGVMPMVEKYVDCSHDFNECSNVRNRDAARAALKPLKPCTVDEWLANCPQSVRDLANKIKQELSEPVAWHNKKFRTVFLTHGHVYQLDAFKEGELTPLYAAPQGQTELLKQALEALESQHKDRLAYSRAKQRANATCASFTPNNLQALIESGYMQELGKQTEAVIKSIKQHLGKV